MTGNVIALRFASDESLAPDAIKRAVKSWRRSHKRRRPALIRRQINPQGVVLFALLGDSVQSAAPGIAATPQGQIPVAFAASALIANLARRVHTLGSRVRKGSRK